MRRRLYRFACFVVVVLWLAARAASAQAAPHAPVVAKLLVRNAYLFTMDAAAGSPRQPFRGYMVVGADGKLTSVAPGDPPASIKARAVYDAGGRWVMPGFVSAHSHLWQSAYRGLASDKTLPGWLDELYGKRAPGATAEDLYWFTLEGALDHLRHGVTSTYNFNYGRSAVGENLAFNEQEFRAESASGVRFVHGFEAGRASATYTIPMAEAQMKTFLDWTASPAAHAAKDRFLSLMINGATAFSESPALQAPMEAALMRRFGVGNQSHYLEQPEDVAGQRALFAQFTQAGLVNDRMIFGHFVHADAAIVQAAAAAHASMAWNPLSNGRLASGTPDIPAYLKAGLRVGMGVDGEASADLADPFENLRTGIYAIRAKYESAEVMSPYQVLRLHTMGSADVLGVADKVGSLEPGKFADFLVIDPSHFGHVFDPYATLVFVAGQPDLERVYVGGELLVVRGRPLRRDLAHVEHEVDRRVAAEAK